MEYESRISFASPDSATEASLKDYSLHQSDHFESLPTGSEDGSIFKDGVNFDMETSELVIQGRGGPAIRVAKLISSQYPTSLIRLEWLTDEMNRNVVFLKNGIALTVENN